MDRGAWQTTVHGVAKSQTRLSTHTHTHTKAIYFGKAFQRMQMKVGTRVGWKDLYFESQLFNFLVVGVKACHVTSWSSHVTSIT